MIFINSQIKNNIKKVYYIYHDNNELDRVVSKMFFYYFVYVNKLLRGNLNLVLKLPVSLHRCSNSLYSQF